MPVQNYSYSGKLRIANEEKRIDFYSSIKLPQPCLLDHSFASLQK